MTQKTGTLHRMRTSGWFDILIAVLVLALVIGAAALIGQISYLITAKSYTEEMGQYERTQALNWFARTRGSLGVIAGILGLFSLVGLLLLWKVSPFIHADIRRQMFMRKVRKWAQIICATIVAAIMLFPIYWMLISSFKSTDELLLPTPTLWPETWDFSSYPNVLKRAPIGLYFYNTMVSTFFIMVFQLSIGILAAYGFSKGEFKHKNTLFIIVLGALMVPIQVTFVPIYVLCAKLAWINTFAGLIVPNLVSAYFIFMLRQTFMSVDNSYLEAGKIDGMGRIGTIVYVLCPMCAPTLITVTIITFINGWNSYFWPKMVTTGNARRTLAVGIQYIRQTFAGLEVSNYNEIMAGAVLAILPIVFLFLILQKYIMTGLSKASMK
ncbi:MAG: carbohydrate ABC transporter permease [Clostridia bacterium]|nr:carbohydrate ABC transporter permease [Clostridia bacterium]